jgi:formylmethanofuran dehydrogenase subunit E
MDLSPLLQRSAARHSHLCPRQVLGVRMGLAGLAALHLDAPITKDTGLVIVETDGCFVDGIEVCTGATIGHRTLRVHDFGKIAATFVRVSTGQAIRISPSPSARARAGDYAPGAPDRYVSQLEGYQTMPDQELFLFQEVALDPTLRALLGGPDLRVQCSRCGEEIINARELVDDGAVVCQPCSGGGYYRLKLDGVAMCTFEAEPVNLLSGGLDEPTAQALSRIP